MSDNINDNNNLIPQSAPGIAAASAASASVPAAVAPTATSSTAPDQRCERFKKYPQFSDFNPRAVGFQGEKKRISEILNREILVLDYRVIKGKYNTDSCVQIQFEMSEFEGKKFIVFSGSAVLQGQLEEAKDRMPFCAVIQRIDKYLTFS